MLASQEALVQRVRDRHHLSEFAGVIVPTDDGDLTIPVEKLSAMQLLALASQATLDPEAPVIRRPFDVEEGGFLLLNTIFLSALGFADAERIAQREEQELNEKDRRRLARLESVHRAPKETKTSTRQPLFPAAFKRTTKPRSQAFFAQFTPPGKRQKKHK